MSPSPVLLYALLAFAVLIFAALCALILLVVGEKRRRAVEREEADDFRDALIEGVAGVKRELSAQIGQTDARLTTAVSSLLTYVTAEQKRSGEAMGQWSAAARGELERMNATLAKEFLSLQGMVDARFAKVLETNARAAEGLGARLNAELREVRGTVDAALEKVRAENAQKLEAMRSTVEEKLERTLTDRLSASFRRVDEKLGLVESGLGEMRRMAQSVSRLQNVLANVKTRGTFGEVQLQAILEEVLAPGQFGAQMQLDPASRERVDFAVRLPGRDAGAPCWLPIDSKFPLEDWELLEEALRAGDAAAAADARKGLERAIVKQAKSIREKYVRPPVTTDFAVMFLPSEGLYAEALRIPGLADRLQRELRVTPAGPTVITALLNSLLMGFMTLAMEKRSVEVWRILTEVKTEFGGFTKQFELVEKKFREAQSSLEAMSAKSRRMGERMRTIESMADAPEDAAALFEGAREALPAATGVTAPAAAAAGAFEALEAAEAAAPESREARAVPGAPRASA